MKLDKVGATGASGIDAIPQYCGEVTVGCSNDV